VILEIETLEPRIVPANPFRFHESFEEPSIRDPIDPPISASDFCSRFEREIPAFEQPSVSSSAPRDALGQFVELPLNVERSDVLRFPSAIQGRSVRGNSRVSGPRRRE